MRCYLTDADHVFDRFDRVFKRDDRAENDLIVFQPDCQYQAIVGFGGAFTEAAASVFARMPDDLQDQFVLSCFGGARSGDEAAGGNAYTLCRTHIQSCDFALGSYAYVRPFDFEGRSFSIDRDRKLLLPFIKCGLAANPNLELFASPWSPPAFMKTNGRMSGGGHLRSSQYDAWARVLARYVDAYAQEGVRIGRMSVQNEPMAAQKWDSCLFTPEEEADFAAWHLRPALAAAGFGDVKLFAWDHNTDRVFERADSMFSGALHGRRGSVEEQEALVEAAATARAAFDGVAFHWYAGDHFEQVNEVAARFPEKELLFTEGCVGYARADERAQSQERNAEKYAHAIIGSLNAGACGFIDWNLLLDECGGPNHEHNFCDSPIMFDREAGQLIVSRSFYSMGHFSRFVVPGSHRCLVSRYDDDVECAGFVRPDGQRVLVALNRHGHAIEFKIAERPYTSSVVLPKHSMCTFVWSADELRGRPAHTHVRERFHLFSHKHRK